MKIACHCILLYCIFSSCTLFQERKHKTMDSFPNENGKANALTDQIGIIGYWEEVKSFTINVAQPETIDAYLTLIVDQLAPDLQKQGLKVQFSGTYFSSPDLPAPRLGGQRVYGLKLSAIKALE